jgi:hypothetical protein
MKFIVTIFLILLSLSSCTDIRFNSEKWKSWDNRESETNLRWDMANDLIENYNLKGKTQSEIIDLLGEPESNVQNPSNDYNYDLVPCRRGIDFGSLIIVFKNGRVIKIEKNCN